MASRTKSFFEQDHSNKVYGSTDETSCERVSDIMKQPRQGQWYRGQNRPPLSDINTNIPRPKPPIPATEQAKSKLKTFQFVPGQLEAALQDENEHTTDANSAPSVHTETIEAVAAEAADVHIVPKAASAQDTISVGKPQLPHANTYPCTPGTRLPLEDLIGNFDDFSKSVIQAPPSPEERIGWIPNSSSNLLTPSRKRKRARSSSPSCPNTSSQRQDASTLLANDEKTTPETDPAADLWKRYAIGKVNEEAAKLPDLDQLMFQGSPRRLETPAKSSGLRRWASAGNDWPTSKSKRRRTQGIPSINVLQEQQSIGSGGKSKVATMVERLQESLASQKLAAPQDNPEIAVQAPSSSSPLPEVGGVLAVDGNPASSPLHEKQRPIEPPQESFQAPAEVHKSVTAVHDQTTKHGIAPRPVGDTYNDKGGSDTTGAIILAPLKLNSKAPLPAFRRPTIKRSTSGGRQYPQRAPVPAPVPVQPAHPAIAAGGGLDEFGDDFDFSAEDLDELMTRPPPVQPRPVHQHASLPQLPQHQLSEAKSRPNPHGQGALANQPIVIDEFDDDDDEFGCNDIDDATLAQVEFRATQAIRASLSRSSVQSGGSR